MRALIYTRVSQDRAGGRSPAEQEAEARQVCSREGWEVAEVVTDSQGASRHSKGTRAGWKKAQTMVEARKVDVLVTWEASRAQRDLEAYAALRRLCATAGVLWNYSGRTYDMSAKDDRFSTGLDALLAEREADEIAERVQRAMRANAAQGRPHGRRLFGYQRVYDNATGALIGQKPLEAEAEVVVRIFRDYLGGQGVRTIARKLNAEGITTNTGCKWNDMQVRRVLTNAAYIGKRVHRGEIVAEGQWPALIDTATFERVQARLVAQRTSQTRQVGTARLLVSIGRCGVCGGKIGAIHDRNQRKVYVCKDRFEVCRDLVSLDAFVSAVIIERLSRPDVAEALSGQEDPAIAAARFRVAELESQLDSAVEQFTAGKLSAATLAKIESKLLPSITEAQQVARRALVPLEVDIPASGIEEWWDALTHEVRREIVGALLSAVVILPTGRGRRVFDTASVRIEWRR